MAVRRKFRCDDCQHIFWCWDEIEDAKCPECEKKAAWEPGVGGIQHVQTKNMDDIAQSLMKEYGMTDMNDNLKEGDSAFKASPSQRKILEKMPQGMFSGGGVDYRESLSRYDTGPKELRDHTFDKLGKAINQPMVYTGMKAKND